MIRKISKKRSVTKKQEQEKAEIFFDYCIQEFSKNPYSIESNKYISNITRLNCAHIFPKRIYKSIQHDFNNIILLTGDEHTRFDNLLDRMDFEALEKEFKSWPTIKRRMINLLPKITEIKNLYLKFEKYIAQ